MTEDVESRLIEIETALAQQERIVDDLNQEIIRQGKLIDRLQKQCEYLKNNLETETVRPLSEETTPPHY